MLTCICLFVCFCLFFCLCLLVFSSLFFCSVFFRLLFGMRVFCFPVFDICPFFSCFVFCFVSDSVRLVISIQLIVAQSLFVCAFPIDFLSIALSSFVFVLLSNRFILVFVSHYRTLSRFVVSFSLIASHNRSFFDSRLVTPLSFFSFLFVLTSFVLTDLLLLLLFLSLLCFVCLSLCVCVIEWMHIFASFVWLASSCVVCFGNCGG